MKVCPQCGRSFPDMQLYCSFDGSTLTPGNASSAAQPAQPSFQQSLQQQVASPAAPPYVTTQQPNAQNTLPGNGYPYQQNQYSQNQYSQNQYSQNQYGQNMYAPPMYYQPALATIAPVRKYMTSKAKTWLIILSILSMLIACGMVFCYIFFGWRAALRQSIGVLTAVVMLILYIFSDRIHNVVFAILVGASVLWSLLQFLYQLLFRGMGLSGYTAATFILDRVVPWILGISVFVVFLLACLNKIQKTPAIVIIGILLLLQAISISLGLVSYFTTDIFGYMGKFYMIATILAAIGSLTGLVMRFIYVLGMYKAREE